LNQLYTRTDAQTLAKLRIVQLDIPAQPEGTSLSTTEQEQRKQARQEHMKKLQAAAQAKRKQIREEQEEELNELKEVVALRSVDPKSYQVCAGECLGVADSEGAGWWLESVDMQSRMGKLGFESDRALDKEVARLQAKVSRNTESNAASDEVPETEEELLAEYTLMNVPDSTLSEEDRMLKKRQRFIYSTKLARIRHKQRQKELEQQRVCSVCSESAHRWVGWLTGCWWLQQAQRLIEEEKRKQDPAKWLASLYTKKQQITERMDKRRKAQEAGKSSGSRRSKLQQDRLRLMNIHAMGSDIDETFVCAPAYMRTTRKHQACADRIAVRVVQPGRGR
jgi:hypothetical protein